MVKKICGLIAIFAVILGLGRVYQTTFAQGAVTVASPLAAAGFTCVDPRPVQGRIYAVVNVSSGLAMDVLDNGGGGASVVQYTFYGGANQEWQFVPLGDGIQFTMSPMHAQGLYLDIQGQSSAEGAQIEVSSSLNSTMNWVVQGNGILQFGSLISVKYIGVQGGSKNLLAKLVQYSDGTPAYMHWQLYTQPINGACPSGSTPTATSVPPTATNTSVPPTVTPTPTAQAFSCTNVTEIPKNECGALVALYNSTNGTNWIEKNGWLTTNTPCSWDNVTCSSGHVLWLNLQSNNLTGTLPHEIGNLTKLENLYLHENPLHGSIPNELGNLTSLHILYLNATQLSGNLPPQLGRLSNLNELFLCCTQLSGNLPPELGDLTNLRELYIDFNQFSGALPDRLRNLTQLQAFYFGNTNVCEPADATFQNWLAGISEISRTGVKCNAPPPATTITIKKDAQPNTTLSFRFTGSLGNFKLVDKGSTTGSSRTFTVVPGFYAVQETVPGGWFLTAITCTPAASGVVDLINHSVGITVASNDKVTCAFTDQKTATLRATLFKDTNGNGTRQSSEPFNVGWQVNLLNAQNVQVATAKTNKQGKVSFTNVPGAYTICEVLQGGLTNPQPCRPVQVGPGQIAEITFANRVAGAAVEANPSMTIFTGPTEIPDETTYAIAPTDDVWLNATLSEQTNIIYLPLISQTDTSNVTVQRQTDTQVSEQTDRIYLPMISQP